MSLTTLCYIEKDDQYLMLHRNKKQNDLNEGKWIGVGGKIEDGESPEECLLREVKEETGFLLTSYQYHGIVTFVSDEWETIYMFLYTADKFEGDRIKTCDEGTLRWVKKKEIWKLSLWQGDRIFLTRMQQSEAPFSLKLCYKGDILSQATLDGTDLPLSEIRKAKLEDLQELSEVEANCFPEAEQASREALEARLHTFAGQFLVLELDGKVIGFINGMVTNQRTISDEMFEEASMHEEEGAWQSIFGLDVCLKHQGQGYGAQLMKAFIVHAKEEGRKGLILTCKKQLVAYYEGFGYRNMGLSKSVHGGAVWYDMELAFCD